MDTTLLWNHLWKHVRQIEGVAMFATNITLHGGKIYAIGAHI